MTNDQTARNERLHEISRIVVLCFQRDGDHRSLCPAFRNDENEKADTLKRIAVATKEIKVRVFRLRRLERGHCGFSLALSREPNELEVVALSLLTAARLDGNCASAVNSVSDVVTLCSSRRLEDAALVRAMFRADGSLFPLVTMSGHGMPLDERRAVLKEEILGRILSLPSDPLHEMLSQLEWRR